MNFQILKTNPELAKNITLQIKGNDLLAFADTLVKDTSAEVEARIRAENKQDELLTRQQVAGMLGITLTTLWNWNNKGILPTIKIGNKVRYRRSDIENLLNKKGAEDE